MEFEKNTLLFGADPTPRIVAIELGETGTVKVYRREADGSTVIDVEPFHPFVWCDSDVVDLGIESEKLQSNLKYGWLVTVDSWKELIGLRNGLKNAGRDFFALTDPVQHYLTATGRTLFKDLPFEELKRLQIETLSAAGIADAGTGTTDPGYGNHIMIQAIDRFQLQRATATGSGLILALSMLFPEDGLDIESVAMSMRQSGVSLDQARKQDAQRPPREPVAPGSYTSGVIILLSDGRRTTGPDPIQIAKLAADRGVRVYTVGFGTLQGTTIGFEDYQIYVRLDEDTLKGIAKITGGEYFHERARTAGMVTLPFAQNGFRRLTVQTAQNQHMEEVQLLCRRIAILDNGRLLAADSLPNLLKRLDARVRLTVAANSPRFVEGLSALPGAKKVTPTERGFDLATDTIPEMLPAVMALAAETGTTITAIEPREPTLERVFLHLTGRELRD